MIIAICSFMSFAKEILEAKVKLEKLGHKVIVPKNAEQYLTESEWKKIGLAHGEETAEFKKNNDLLRDYFLKIKKSDAILVLNFTKKGIENYIGGNTFLEIGFAHILKKKIYFLNPIPKIEYYFDEIKAMNPYIINQDLLKLKL